MKSPGPDRLAFFLLSATLMTPLRAAGEPTAAPFPYDDWSRVLERVVDERGRIDYVSLGADSEALDRVIAAIAAVSPRSHPERFRSRAHELAYYLNAYNALVFRGVLDKGPGVKPVWGAFGTGLGFFVQRKVTVGGERVSLKRFEDEWVREGFGDPRIHAALNCASTGCPRLPKVPFSPAALDVELDLAMAEFVSSPPHVEVDDAQRVVTLSKIFDWFTEDFLEYEERQGSRRPSLIDYVNRYRDSESQIPTDYRVRFAKYDKSLNRQP